MSFRNKLGNNHPVVFKNLLLCMSKVIRLFINGVTTRESCWQWVVKRNLRLVMIWVDKSNLLQAVLKSVTIIDSASINEGLGSPELRYCIDLGLFCLLMKGRQLHHQTCLNYLHFLSKGLLVNPSLYKAPLG